MSNYQPVIVKKEIDDSHFYWVDGIFFPSVTEILDASMPMPFALRQWIGEVGNDKAESKLERAGARGTALHQACEALIRGEELRLHDMFPAQRDQKCIVGFVNWINDFQPTFVDVDADIEMVVASTYGYAGTLDFKCLIDPELILKLTKMKVDHDRWIVDIKSSAAVYDSHKLQINAYEGALHEMTGLHYNKMILHLNPKTKAGYSCHVELEIGKKTVTIDDFMTVFAMYKMLNGGVIKEPSEVNVFPEIIKLYADGRKD